MASTPIPVPTIDAAGFHLPSDADVLAGLYAAYRGIYGQDILFDSSDQDTQWLGLIASALRDAYTMAFATYSAYSPKDAQGLGLDSIVKLNGISRKVAGYSTATVTVIGQPRDYANLAAGDGVNRWVLPPIVTVPPSGTIDVTATCATLGAVQAAAGAISQILTPTIGLQSIANAAPATVGAAVETDAQLRARQRQSTMLPSQTVLDGIVGALLALPGVVSAKPYENDDDTVDSNGIPAHGTAFVIDGGDPQAICQTIALKKTQGSPTYGNTYQVVPQGIAQVPRRINFFRPVRPVVTYLVTVATLPGYTLDTRAAIKQALSDFTNAQGVGASIAINDTYAPVLGVSLGGARPFKVLSITAARGGAVTQAQDVPMAFYEAATCAPANVGVIETAA